MVNDVKVAFSEACHHSTEELGSTTNVAPQPGAIGRAGAIEPLFVWRAFELEEDFLDACIVGFPRDGFATLEQQYSHASVSESPGHGAASGARVNDDYVWERRDGQVDCGCRCHDFVHARLRARRRTASAAVDNRSGERRSASHASTIEAATRAHCCPSSRRS